MFLIKIKKIAVNFNDDKRLQSFHWENHIHMEQNL